MAKIPLGDFGNAILKPGPKVQVVPGAFDNGGAALESIGNMAGDIFRKVQDDIDKTEIEGASIKAKKLDTDLRLEMFQLEGNAALKRPDGKTLSDEYVSKLKVGLSSISAGLSGERQKQAFNRIGAQIEGDLYSLAGSHSVKQYKVVRAETQGAKISTATNRGSLFWGDGLIRQQSADEIRTTINEMAADQGWDDVVKQAKFAEAMSPLHDGVISGMVDGERLDLARKYYDENAPTMSAAVRAKSMNLLETGAFEKKTQDAAGIIYAQSGGDAKAALKLVREKYYGKDEDAIVTRLKILDAEETTLRERDQKDVGDKAWDLYAKGRKIPASVLAGMDGRDRVALRNTMRAEAEARIGGTTVKTDPNIYYALSLAAEGDPNFKGEDLRRYRDKLSPEHFTYFVKLQAKSLKPEEQSAIVSINTQKSQTARAAGLNTKQAAQFYIEADRTLGPDAKSLTYEQRQKALDRLVLPGEVKGGMVDPNVRLYEAQQSGRAETFTPDFSDSDRRKANAALQKAGVPTPSKKQIEETMRRAYGFTK